MDTLSLGATSNLESFIEPAPVDCASNCTYQPFRFDWKAGETIRPESASYKPLVAYVLEVTKPKAKAKDISAGTGLPGGFFFEVDLHTLRPRIGVRSNELRITNSEPRYMLHLRGRSDVVVWDAQYRVPGRTTTRYCIEVKTNEGMRNKNECLREAFLQLIGLNAYNDYKSPAVILTNLTKLHYVLYLSLETNECGSLLKYNLNIHQFSFFAHALWFAEVHLGDRQPCCRDLFRAATPVATGRQQQEVTSDVTEDRDDQYDNVVLEERSAGHK